MVEPQHLSSPWLAHHLNDLFYRSMRLSVGSVDLLVTLEAENGMTNYVQKCLCSQTDEIRIDVQNVAVVRRKKRIYEG